ncbi:hypothetical protein Cni_G06463 [Canna indica]|uniref:Endonuclease/exonuclease/phosphatase domain-containing protein n=1 Tax=Canna indica TaxID=4628 RepID=A0AAQ3Q414_9LILI|nr:hypothetical protein Cni_G06463 [Canna indica]
MILLLKTHLDEANSHLCMSRFGKAWKGLFVAGNGRCGGIIFMWKDDLLSVKEVYKCTQMINVTISYNHSEPWLFTGLYASTNSKERKELWNLLNKLDTSDTLWLISGDFNCIDKAEDKIGGKPFLIGNSLRAFNDLRTNARLIDLSFFGMRYTWCNNRVHNKRIQARLDKAYANERWLQKFSRTMVKHLKRLASDHRPILIDSKPKDYPIHAKRGFIFEHYWTDYQEINTRVRNSWDSIEWSNCSMEKIPLRHHEALVKEFSLEEIWQAISSMGRGKAPGPNCFTMEFFLHH